LFQLLLQRKYFFGRNFNGIVYIADFVIDIANKALALGQFILQRT
jgi:hypothetical protein